jgi:hypothetical protein
VDTGYFTIIVIQVVNAYTVGITLKLRQKRKNNNVSIRIQCRFLKIFIYDNEAYTLSFDWLRIDVSA